MNKKNIYLNKDITVPNTLNILISLMAMMGLGGLLWLASQTSQLYVKVFCFIAFGYVGNTVFGLLHEAVHGAFNTNRKLNYIFGNIFAAFFPTAFSFQRRCHLNHHRQNRTDYEMFEAYHENDNKTLKTAMLYFILTGVYWLSPPIGSLWLMISPKTLLRSAWSGKDNYQRGRMGGAGMLRNLADLPSKEMTTMRLEVLFSLGLQIALFYFLDLTLLGWLTCYLGFAIQWSALQYADHAYSARDIRNGAWNLKVSKFTHFFYLNYHHHLAHHQHPHVPWIHLPKFVDFNSERPTFWEIYFRMWKGLEKVDVEKPQAIDKSFEGLIESDSFTN